MMCKIKIHNILAGLFLAVAFGTQSAGQTRDLTDPETLIKAEERAEALRTELFDLKTQEIELQARLDELNNRLTPRAIQRALAFVGSVRPMDELRDALRARLEGEKARVSNMLELIAARRERLEVAIGEADARVERLRQRLK